MALFKISKGLNTNLPTTITEGYCWYTYDDSKFYIDYKDEKGVLTRKALNAKDAETLTGASLETILNSSNLEIPTSKAVLDALANKADKTTTVNGHALNGNVTVTKSDIGLGNVENKSSTTIRGELTKANVTDALGYTPLDADDAYEHPTSHPASMITGLATVATSGSYNDLTDKPTVPVISVAGKTGAVTLNNTDVGLSNVENKSSATIRGELTSANVTTALGYTPLPNTVDYINTDQNEETSSLVIAERGISWESEFMMEADGGTVSEGTMVHYLPVVAGDNITFTKKTIQGDVVEISGVTPPVTSVAGKTGAVTLDKTDVGLGNVGNFKAVSTVANQGLSDTEKANARANIGAGASSFSGSYDDLTGIPEAFTPTAHNQASSTINAMTGYTKPLTTSAIAKSDTLNAAIGKLEAGLGLKANQLDLATVASTGSYNDLTNKPTSMTPTAHNQAANTINAMTDYSKPSSTSAIAVTDTLNTAIGKLEKALDGKQASGSYSTTGHKHAASDITSGTLDIARLPSITSDKITSLDASKLTGTVPTSALPSYVDDVLEYTAKSSFPATGETGKIYVDTATNKTYRWGGSAYVEISASLALGETSSTAYYGDKGKIAYDHSQASHAPSNAEANVQSDWNVTDTTNDAYIKNKPTIPTVNNGTLTIQKNSTTIDTFSANSASNKTINITVPTGAAADKGVDTSISAASTSTNLPTSKAVAAFVEGKGYKTTDNNTSHGHSVGVGLVGSGDAGTSGGTYNYKAALVNETKSSNASAYAAGGTSKFYAVQLDKDGKLAVNVPWTDTNTQDGNDNQKVKTGSVTFGANDIVEFVAGSNVSISGDATNKKITISATDTNTDTHNSHAIISGKKADGTTDIKGSASSGDITLGDSGVTAGEYGPTANATPGYGATFDVPDIKVNAKGIVTSITNRTVKIPASDNSETTLTITDKANTDTTDVVYAVSNLVEGGTKGHAITPTYTGLPTKAYVDTKLSASQIKTAAGSNINSVGTPSVTTSTDSSNNVTFTFNYLKGATGATGASSEWYTGTGITGTSTTATVFSGSGVSAATVGDMYLNTSTYNVYRCSTAGAASAAKWVYVCNIKGAAGVSIVSATITAV